MAGDVILGLEFAGAFLGGAVAALVGLWLYFTRRVLPKLMPGLTVGAIGTLASLARRPSGRPGGNAAAGSLIVTEEDGPNAGAK